MWWVLFTAADLYVGLIVLDALAPSLPTHKKRRLAWAKKTILAIIGVLGLTFVWLWLRSK